MIYFIGQLPFFNKITMFGIDEANIAVQDTLKFAMLPSLQTGNIMIDTVLKMLLIAFITTMSAKLMQLGDRVFSMFNG